MTFRSPLAALGVRRDGSRPGARTRSARARASAVVLAAATVAVLLAGCAAEPNGLGEGAAAAEVPAAAHTASPDAPLRPVLASTAGDVLGGVTDTITAAGAAAPALAEVHSVTFGGASAPITKRTRSTLVVTVPAAADYQPATVTVSLLDRAGSVVATLDDGYTYAASSPVGRQLAYALKYWKNYNSAEYGNLNPVGGDCANFVSQTLVARGWSMTDAWHNHGAGADWSPAWGYVPAMDDYFAANAASLGLQRLDSAQRDQVALGDIGIFDWGNTGARDHVEVVSAIRHVDGKTLIEFASHNLDYSYRDLDQTLTVEHPGATMHFWHLTR